MAKRRHLLIFIPVFFSVFFFFSTNKSYASVSDIDGHWAKPSITKWVDRNLVKGYADGTFQPDMTITRAEFIALVNRIFNYSSVSGLNFSDINENDWFAADIKKAVKAGYINGYSDGTMRPEIPITRQEASRILAVAFGLELKSGELKLRYADSSDIEDWAYDYVARLSQLNIIKGNENNLFAPEDYLTRAEAVAILDRMCGDIINNSNQDINGKKYSGNVIVNSGGVKIINSEIDGDLYLSEGISSDILLENVTVRGNIYVRNCNTENIVIKQSFANGIVVDSSISSLKITLNGLKADSVTLKTSSDLNIIAGSNIGKINIDSASQVLVADNCEVSEINLSKLADNSVLFAKPGIKFNSSAGSITVNNKKFGAGSYVTEDYNFDLIDIK